MVEQASACCLPAFGSTEVEPSQLEQPLNVFTEAGVDPRHRQQNQTQHDERENPVNRLQIPQVVEKYLEDADEQHREPLDPQDSFAHQKAGREQREPFEPPKSREQTARSFAENDRRREQRAQDRKQDRRSPFWRAAGNNLSEIESRGG